MSRTLETAPTSFLDPNTGRPAYGAYAGVLPAIELGRLGLRDRITRRKRWVYAAISSEELWVSLAVVRTGYVATAFAFAYDLVGRRMLLDDTALGPSLLARVTDDFRASGNVARFAMGKTHVALTRSAGGLEVHIRTRDLALDATIDESAGPPGIAAIAPLGEQLVDATEKRTLLPVRGRARCGARTFGLDGAIAGYDYTNALLPRHTVWRWAFAMGKTSAGEPFGFNVVQGFVGEAECAAFLDGQVSALAEPRFDFDLADPMRPWRIVGEGIDLTFTPGGVHAQATNLLVVKSRFVQPVGSFTGTVRVRGRDVAVAGLPGVVEDQDVLW